MEEKKLLRRKEKARDEGNNENLGFACKSLGDFYNQQGRYHEACKEYQQGTNIFSKLGKQLETAICNRMMAETFMLLGESEKALKHANIFLKMAKQIGNKIEVQRAYTTLGRTYLLQGQEASNITSASRPLKLAEKAFIQGLLICKELSGQISKVELLDMQARLYLNIGVTREHLGDLDESISYLEKAIKICKANDLYDLLHNCYESASLLYQKKKSDTLLALRFCNLALEVAERLPNRAKKECATRIIKADIMIQEGDFQSAKQVLRRAYKLKSPEINDREGIERTLKIVAALCNTLDQLVTTNSDDYETRKSLYEKMGDGCCLLQNYNKAIDYYLKMLECAEFCKKSPKDLVAPYVSLYQTYKDNKQYDKALEYLWKEYEVNKDEPVEAFNTLCNIADIYELESKPFWETQDCYQKAIEEARKANSSRLERIGFIRLMKLQQKFNMFTSMEILKDDANKRGIELDNVDDDSDSENGQLEEHNTPDIGDDICLDDLTDSEEEEIGTKEKKETARPQRRRNVGITVKRNTKGETPLHQACIAGNLELVRRLIDQGHAINVRDHAGWLPLHEACNHGFREIVEILLDNGASSAINDKGGTNCDGITPLYDACSNGFTEIVDLLLERGANATLKTDFGDTTLNVLDKWRSTADLDPFEQGQYEKVRSKIAEQLDKAGMLSENNDLISPSHHGSATKRNSNDHEVSLELLRRLACDSDSDNSDGVSSSRRHSKGKKTIFEDDVENEVNTTMELNETSPVAYTNTVLHTSNAKEEYKSVMESLKHPKRSFITSEISSKKRSGYLNPDEIDDDWLIEDMKPDKKKRKMTTDRNLYSSDPNSRTSFSSNSKENMISPFKNYSDDENSQDAFRILLDSKGVPRKSSKNKLPRSSSLTGSNHLKRQSSLLDSGFSRFRSESPQSVEESSELEPDSTTTIILPVERSPQKEVNPVVTTVSFKIKVEDEMLLIPVERKKLMEANIRWLAEETSRRYYNLVGLRPVLRLMTADGFAFEENDVINVALEYPMIAGKVLEWKISPLSQRYEEMCCQLQLSVNDNIKSVLEKSQSNCILLNDQALMPDATLPIFKALLHQTTLRVLDLSNNFIQNEGCKQLSRPLETLKHLNILNLRGNCITSVGLSNLTSARLTELEDLDLSYNPLGNASIKEIDQICCHATELKKLHLSSCNISNFYDFDLQFFNLTNFNMSFNSLTQSAAKSVILKLNSCRMQYLNLNFCTVNEHPFGSYLLEFLQSGTCEKFRYVELAGCHLTDMDVFNLTTHLSKAKDLEEINLSMNPKLTPRSLRYIFEYIPHVKRIHIEHCWPNTESIRWDELNLEAAEKKTELIILSGKEEDENTLRQLWDSKHGSHAKFLVEGDLFKLYTNDCDLR